MAVQNTLELPENSASSGCAADIPDMSASYDSYISSGLYDRRYPHPNRRTLRRMTERLPENGRFLDIGAGTGRYTLPLLQHTGASGVAQDICPTACRVLADRLETYSRDGRVEIHSGDIATMEEDNLGAFDLAILAFGVLGHVAGRDERVRLLKSVRSMLKPGGSLVLGLPNARRRFRGEQRAAAAQVRAGTLEPGDILYTRGEGAGTIRMFYHLFTCRTATEELSSAGFRVERMEPESLLAEESAVRRPVLGRLDAAACGIVSPEYGYGFLMVCRPKATASR